MFCEKCGNKIDLSYKFCIKCGYPNNKLENNNFSEKKPEVTSSEKWWHRLLKVLYIFLYVQILWIVPVVWSENLSSTSYYGGKFNFEYDYGKAFWLSILAVVIFIIIVKLVKITVLYIIRGQKPEWKNEFKNIF